MKATEMLSENKEPRDCLSFKLDPETRFGELIPGILVREVEAGNASERGVTLATGLTPSQRDSVGNPPDGPTAC